MFKSPNAARFAAEESTVPPSNTPSASVSTAVPANTPKLLPAAPVTFAGPKQISPVV